MAASVAATRSKIFAFASAAVPRTSPYYFSAPPSLVTLTLPGKKSSVVGVSKRNFWQSSSSSSNRAIGGFRVLSMAPTMEAASTIQVGEKLPEAELAYMDKEGEVQVIKVSELTEGKKVVLFAVPGAFTPTCSSKHVPQFVAKADELKKKGVDTIACVSVNDVFVMRAWGEGLGVGDKILMLSDGNSTFTKALGVELDLSDKPVGLFKRSRRYAMLVENGVVKNLNLEEGGAFSISGPDEILKVL